MALGVSPSEIVETNEFPLLVKHNSWDRVFLSEIAGVQNGFPFSSDLFTKGEGMPLIRIRDITQNRTEHFFSGDFSKEFIIKKGDILIGMDGDFNLSVWKGEPGLLNQRVCRIILKSPFFSQQFLIFCLPAYLKAINSKTSSVTVKHLSSFTVNDIPIPLPPLPEQHRIVAKIEELFSSLDKGIESLKTAQQQLKVYRQAVLKWAFEGRFTNKNVKEGELPEGWAERKVSEIADIFGGQAFKSADFKEEGRYQVIRIGNIRPGLLRYEESPVYIDNIEENVLKKALLKTNDIVITQTGTKGKRDYGFTALIARSNLLVNQRIAAMRCRKGYIPKYLLYFTWIDKFKNQFFANETGNVGQGNVGMRAITDSYITIPTMTEQQAIVSEIEDRLSVCDKMEEIISQSLEQAEALRQSILKKAFEGKLVPQDPNDEPASVLLERIRAEREKEHLFSQNKVAKRMQRG